MQFLLVLGSDNMAYGNGYNKPTGSFNGGVNKGRDTRGGYDRKPVDDFKPTFPVGYLAHAYLDENGKRDRRYVLSFAEHIGKALSNDQSTGKSKIRSYFDAALSIKEAVFNKHITEDEAMVRLGTLKSRVVDRAAKGNASKYFVDFIGKNIDVIVSDEDKFKERLRHFCEHFEAVVCYTAEKKSRG